MARRFVQAPDFELARWRVDGAVNTVADRLDRDALVYTTVSGMGRIHVIVVSDVITESWGAERDERLWENLAPLVQESDADLISVLQVISVAEALRLHGPIDADRLVKIGEELLERWRFNQAALNRGEPDILGRLQAEEGLVGETVDWMRAADLVVRNPGAREALNDLKAVKELKGHTQALQGGFVLHQIPRHIEGILGGLRQVALAQVA